MRIGAMNNPHNDVYRELRWIGAHGFDFVDLTLEPPHAMAETLDVRRVKDLLGEYRLGIVGHTTPFLPFATPYETVRKECVAVIVRGLEVFAELGATCVNMHLNHSHGAQPAADNIERNRRSLEEASAAAQERGLTLMVEHFGATYASVGPLRRILDSIPALGFHLDVGHANLWRPGNSTEELLNAFGSRLRHVHVSDNHGGDRDEHLPLGAGNIRWPWMIQLLRRHGYDDTITPEVFSADRDYLLIARDKLRDWWDAALDPPAPSPSAPTSEGNPA